MTDIRTLLRDVFRSVAPRQIYNTFKLELHNKMQMPWLTSRLTKQIQFGRKPEAGEQPEAGKQPEADRQPEADKQPKAVEQLKADKQPGPGEQPEADASELGCAIS